MGIECCNSSVFSAYSGHLLVYKNSEFEETAMLIENDYVSEQSLHLLYFAQ